MNMTTSEVQKESLPRKSSGAYLDTVLFVMASAIAIYVLLGFVLSHFYFALTSLSLNSGLEPNAFTILIFPLIFAYSVYLLKERSGCTKKEIVTFFIIIFITFTPFLLSIISVLLHSLMDNNEVVRILADTVYQARYQGIIISSVLTLVILSIFCLTKGVLGKFKN